MNTYFGLGDKMGNRSQDDKILRLNSEELEALLASVRNTDGYLEMEIKIRQLVLVEGAKPLERLGLLHDGAAGLPADSRQTLINEVQYDLATIIMKKVADMDGLSFDERLFMMLMIEDIVRAIVREAASLD